mmetsp:Transcript_19307/g.31087  ORF Transcript_19307/g.31087 Transcript_19307/m.31087 type:complete len:204 (-) Transcript_19307:1181-1792(-)
MSDETEAVVDVDQDTVRSQSPVTVQAPLSESNDADDKDDNSRNRKTSEETVATVPDEDVSSGTYEDDGGEASEEEHDAAPQISSKSLASNASKAPSTKQVSSKSINSQNSNASESATEGGKIPTSDDLARVRDQLQKSLQEEKRLLGLQQQLLLELEGIEVSIVKAESEERIARLSSQQAYVTRLMSKVQTGEEEETRQKGQS